jgi:hypothetical protein
MRKKVGASIKGAMDVYGGRTIKSGKINFKTLFVPDYQTPIFLSGRTEYSISEQRARS